MPNTKDISSKTFFQGRGAGEKQYRYPEKGRTTEERINRRLENHNAMPPDHRTVTNPTRTVHNVHFSGHPHSPVRPGMPNLTGRLWDRRKLERKRRR
jgi:hypothetical protein